MKLFFSHQSTQQLSQRDTITEYFSSSLSTN